MTKPDKSKPNAPRMANKSKHADREVPPLPPKAPAAPSEAPGHQEKLSKISGLPAVTALFRCAPTRVVRLYYNDAMKKAVGDFCAQMAKMQRPYRLVEESELQKISGTLLHGGVVAAALPRVVPDVDVDAARGWARAGEPLVILDGVGNPNNLGAIARTLAYFGLRRLLLSDHPAQAGLSDSAHRTAEGGLEHLDIYRTSHLPQLLRKLRESYRVVGTALSEKARAWAEFPDDPRPFALVLGNEEFGLPRETLDACEATVWIRGSGQIESLNVSATAAILVHQIAVGSRRSPAKKRYGGAAVRDQQRPRRRQRGTTGMGKQ